MITGLLIAILAVAVLTLYLVAWYVHREVTATPEVQHQYEMAQHKPMMGTDGVVRLVYSAGPNGPTIHAVTQTDGVATGANIPTYSEPSPQHTLGVKVRTKRLDLGLSQTALGQVWGMSDSTVSNIEHGCSKQVDKPLVRKAIDDFIAHGLPETAAKK